MLRLLLLRGQQKPRKEVCAMRRTEQTCRETWATICVLAWAQENDDIHVTWQQQKLSIDWQKLNFWSCARSKVWPFLTPQAPHFRAFCLHYTKTYGPKSSKDYGCKVTSKSATIYHHCAWILCGSNGPWRHYTTLTSHSGLSRGNSRNKALKKLHWWIAKHIWHH